MFMRSFRAGTVFGGKRASGKTGSRSGSGESNDTGHLGMSDAVERLGTQVIFLAYQLYFVSLRALILLLNVAFALICASRLPMKAGKMWPRRLPS